MRLLIVEDDMDGREMLTELFRMHAWNVTAVATTRAAMDYLRAGGFDVVISDENIEGESGSFMLRSASAEGLLSDVGVLMYTAESGRLAVPPGVRVLRKPLGLARLLEEAQALVSEGAAPPSSRERVRRGAAELVRYLRLSRGELDPEPQSFLALIEEMEAQPPSSRSADPAPPSSGT